MIVRARFVVTMDGPPIEDGAVAIADDRISDVGTFTDVKLRAPGEVLDLGEQVLLPGLINAHCHLDYTCLRAKISRQKSFTDWIRAINAEKSKLGLEDYIGSIANGFEEALRFGTTTIGNLTAFPELIVRIAAPIRTCWFAELIDVRVPDRPNEIIDRALSEVKTAKNWGLAPHALFTASAALYQLCEKESPLLTTHLAESRDEMEMFARERGELYEFLSGLGRDMGDCGGRTPVAYFLSIISPEPIRPWILVHLNELNARDWDLLAGAEAAFHVVHCPRSHRFFGHSPFQFERFHDLGFNICLGTDSLASNDDLSLFAEMRAFQEDWPAVSPETILAMVTLNPARALQRERAPGRIRPGSPADLVAIPFSDSRKDAFEAIVAFTGLPWVMTAGKIA